jgi:hypothetical protein
MMAWRQILPQFPELILPHYCSANSRQTLR